MLFQGPRTEFEIQMKKEAAANFGMANNSEDCFASPGSIFAIVDNIHWAIASAKHNKAYVLRFVTIIKQITKVLNGADVHFIRQAEFYSDLKETLFKIEHHIKESSTRGKWMNKLMAKKNERSYEEFEKHVDHLITRIVFCFAQRVHLINLAREKRKALSEIPEVDENEKQSLCDNGSTSFEERSDVSGEEVSQGSEEEISGER